MKEKTLKRQIGLIKNNKLQTLWYARRKIGDAELQQICEALKYNTSVKEIYLSYNQITDKGLSELINLMLKNDTILNIDIRNNLIQDINLVHQLKAALKANKNINQDNHHSQNANYSPVTVEYPQSNLHELEYYMQEHKQEYELQQEEVEEQVQEEEPTQEGEQEEEDIQQFDYDYGYDDEYNNAYEAVREAAEAEAEAEKEAEIAMSSHSNVASEKPWYEQLEEMIGYQFKDLSLLNKARTVNCNIELESIGDALFDITVDYYHGLEKQKLCTNEYLNNTKVALFLKNYLCVSQIAGKMSHGDAVEALLGAVFIDSKKDQAVVEKVAFNILGWHKVGIVFLKARPNEFGASLRKLACCWIAAYGHKSLEQYPKLTKEKMIALLAEHDQGLNLLLTETFKSSKDYDIAIEYVAISLKSIYQSLEKERYEHYILTAYETKQRAENKQAQNRQPQSTSYHESSQSRYQHQYQQVRQAAGQAVRQEVDHSRYQPVRQEEERPVSQRGYCQIL